MTTRCTQDAPWMRTDSWKKLSKPKCDGKSQSSSYWDIESPGRCAFWAWKLIEDYLDWVGKTCPLWHHSLGWDTGLYKKDKSELNTIIHCSLLAYSVWNVTSDLNLPLRLSYHEGPYPRTMSQNTFFLFLSYFCHRNKKTNKDTR